MLREELYRVLFKRRFFIILLAAILLEIVLFTNSARKTYNLDKESVVVFQSLMQNYGGELTSEKEAEIEALRIEREETENRKQALKESYISGKLFAEEFRNRLVPIRNAIRGTDGYNRFIQLYEEALTGNDYLADTSVWELLFAADRFDPIYVITIILFCFILGVVDEETGANRLLITTIEGKKALQRLRLIVASVFTFLLSVLIFGGKFVLAAYSFHLDGYSFPLHTAEMFRYSQSNLTLTEGFICLHLIRMLGGILLAHIVLLFGELTRSSLYTVFLSAVVVFLPGYLLQGSQLKYLLPFPSGLLTAGGYFGASEACNFVVNETGEMQLRVFHNGFMIPFFCLTVFLVFLIGMANELLWKKRRRT